MTKHAAKNLLNLAWVTEKNTNVTMRVKISECCIYTLSAYTYKQSVVKDI